MASEETGLTDAVLSGPGVSQTSWAELATKDSLTGVSNRRTYQQSVVNALAAEQRPTVLILDLDRFKAVNDTLGHPIGDLLLGRVSDRIRSAVSSQDLLARLGGDEFAILSPASPRQEIEELANRIIELLERPFFVEGHPINIGVSIGIAAASEAGMTYELLMKQADLALYAAKEAGRSGFRWFHQSLEERAMARRQLELDLRRALALRQFEVHYHPRLDIDTGALIGLQAMLFWRHPKRGLLDPDAFLPLATQIRLDSSLGNHLLERACREMVDQAGSPRIAVSVSPSQFATHAHAGGSFVQVVQKALLVTGLSADRLEIQVAESTLLSEQEEVLKTLHELRALGVRVVMNDFGRGYASLIGLTSFPFDGMNLAPQFWLQTHAVSNYAMIHAMASLGSSLGVKVHIDGMTSREEMEQLRRHGVSALSGSRLGPSLSSMEVRDFLAQSIQSSSQEMT